MYIGCDTYELLNGKITLTLEEINDLVFEIQEHRIVRVDHYLSDLLRIRRLEEKVEKQKAEIKGYKAELKKLKPKKAEIK